jgi:hypothetical protein
MRHTTSITGDHSDTIIRFIGITDYYYFGGIFLVPGTMPGELPEIIHLLFTGDNRAGYFVDISFFLSLFSTTYYI